MKVKDFFRRVRSQALYLAALHQAQKCLITEIASPKGTAYDSTHVSGGEMGDLSNKILQMYAESSQLASCILTVSIRLMHDRCEALRQIDKLGDAKMCAVLIEYYINAHTWPEVAGLTGYSLQHVYRLHGEALNALRERTGDYVAEA